MTDCSGHPVIIHGESHQTFPFDSNGNGIQETCAYPGTIPHNHSGGPVSHTHTYYPYEPGAGCTHSHLAPTGEVHWDEGSSCQAQVEPDPEFECPNPGWETVGGECSVTPAVCEGSPALVHGDPHPTFPFSVDGDAAFEICAYPGDADHTHEQGPQEHQHAYYPFNRPGDACLHSHLLDVGTEDSHVHWEVGSCQIQAQPVESAERPSPFPPACIPAQPIPPCHGPVVRTEQPASRDIDGDGADDICPEDGFIFDFEAGACWDGPTEEDVRNHWNLWKVEKVIGGDWVVTDWPMSACGPRVVENENCGHSARAEEPAWRETYVEPHGDQLIYLRSWEWRSWECYPEDPLTEHKHDAETCEADHPPVPECVPGLGPGETQSFPDHDADGNNITVEVGGCPCEPETGEHAHGVVCEPDHPPVPECVEGLTSDEGEWFDDHDADDNNVEVWVRGCIEVAPDCVPAAGEHPHGPTCEADHPPVPECVPGLPADESEEYPDHNDQEQNIKVTVWGCGVADPPDPPSTPPGVPTGLTVTCFGWQEPAGDYGDGYYTVFVSWDAQSGAGVVFELSGDLGYVGAAAQHTGVVAAVVVADPDDEELEVLAPVTVGVRVRATSAGVTSAYSALAQDTCSPPPCPAAVPAAVAGEARARYGDLRWEGWLGAYDGTQAQIAQSAVPGGDQTLLPASLLSVIDGVPDSVVWLTEHGRDNGAPGVSWQSARDPESGCSWRLDEINVALRELLFTDAADLALADTESGGQWDYWAQAVDIWDDTSAQQQQYWAVWHDRGAYGGDGVPAGYGLPARCETSRGPARDSRDDCDISARCRAADVPEATFRGTPERANRTDPSAGCAWVVPREGYWEWWIEWELVPERDENCDQPDAACWIQIGRGMSRFLKLTGPAGLIELNQPDDP